MTENNKMVVNVPEGAEACPYLPAIPVQNEVTGRLQGFSFSPCLKDGCKLYADGDCTLKGIFHKNFKNKSGLTIFKSEV